jgi:hypothetical protein
MSDSTSPPTNNGNAPAASGESSMAASLPFDQLKGVENCPPCAALASDGLFYACHEFDPSTDSDFRTAAQRNVYKNVEECQRRSNSILADMRDAKALMKRHQLYFKCISEGHVTPTDGYMLDTSATSRYRSHFSFWVCSRTSMRVIFCKRVA